MATFRVQAHSSVPACKAPLRQSRLVPHVLGSQGVVDADTCGVGSVRVVLVLRIDCIAGTNDFSQAKRREFLSQVSGMILGEWGDSTVWKYLGKFRTGN